MSDPLSNDVPPLPGTTPSGTTQPATGQASAPVAASAVPPPPHAAGPQPIEWQWPPIHREGWKFGGLTGVGALIAFLAGGAWLGWPLLVLTLAILAFFRDPRRASPAGEGMIISPADGLISQIMEVERPRQLVGEGLLAPGTCMRISIFMSVFDVHVNRTPIAGIVKRLAYVPGAFVNAALDKASEENERQYLLVEASDGTRVGITQIAGLVARRIVGFVREGAIVGTGQRIGLIRFGSRVDVFLPEGWQPQVVKGQRAVAGETVLAVRNAAAAIPGPRQ